MSETTQFKTCGNSDNMRTAFNALRAQVTELHSTIDSLLAKLDADTGTADSDYVSGEAPAADTSFDLTEF